MTPRPEPQEDVATEGIVNTSGSHATEDDPSPADPGTDEVSTGTNTGQDTKDRATGLTAFN
ncbi:MAG: hypothetical protein JO250_22275 [Armatimonadetes bacterium]|nr:hypothetical protein [Armatimonadota bacterium]